MTAMLALLEGWSLLTAFMASAGIWATLGVQACSLQKGECCLVREFMPLQFSVVPQTLWALLTMEIQCRILSKEATEAEL